MARPRITEIEAEKMQDRLVWRWLERDSAYNNAENAEQQAEREEQIGLRVWRDIRNEYDVEGDDVA